VLKWIVERLSGCGTAVKTPIGNLPTADALDLTGLDISKADLEELLRVDNEAWRAEIANIREDYKIYGDKLPAELAAQLEALEKRLA